MNSTLSFCSILATINNLQHSRPHQNYKLRMIFYDIHDLMKPYNIFGVLTVTHAYFTAIMASRHFSLVLAELQILNSNLWQISDNFRDSDPLTVLEPKN